MSGKIRWVVIGWAIIFFWRIVAPVTGNGESEQFAERLAVQQLQVITPMSINMVDKATIVLSGGWSAMNPAEQEVFRQIYDPSNTGDIDDQYLMEVLQNYQRIRTVFDSEIKVEYEPNSRICIGQRLYYTDLSKLHVCRQFLFERDAYRKARTLIHEVAHKALLALDRPYYGPASPEYVVLSPRGLWSAQLPLVGPVFRELSRRDTLYHPDAYAHFARAVSGQPGAIDLYLYLDHENAEPVANEHDISSENATNYRTGVTWIRRH